MALFTWLADRLGEPTTLDAADQLAHLERGAAVRNSAIYQVVGDASRGVGSMYAVDVVKPALAPGGGPIKPIGLLDLEQRLATAVIDLRDFCDNALPRGQLVIVGGVQRWRGEQAQQVPGVDQAMIIKRLELGERNSNQGPDFWISQGPDFYTSWIAG